MTFFRFLFSIPLYCLEAYLILDFLCRYFSMRLHRPYCWIALVGGWAVSSLSLCLLSQDDKLIEFLPSLVQIALNALFCLLFLKGRAVTKLFLSAFIMAVFFLCRGTAMLLMETLRPTYAVDSPFERLPLMVLFLTMVLFYEALQLVLHVSVSSKKFTPELIPLVTIPVVTIFAIYLLLDMAKHNYRFSLQIFLLFCLILLLNGLVYYLFLRLSRSNQLKKDYELLRQQYDYTRQGAEDLQALYEKVRSIRHDMNNHLLCLSHLLQESPQGQAPLDYVQSLLQQQKETQQSFVFSGNDALDAILNAKQAAAHRLGISVQTLVSHPLSFLPPEDIAVLLGNLMDNAISAAKDTQEKVIRLSIQPQDTYVSIQLSNSIAAPVLTHNPDLHTTKSHREGHGYGIRNVKQVVQARRGLLRFHEEDHQFFCDILLLDPEAAAQFLR